MNIHFDFGEDVPDLLLDLLVRGFDDIDRVAISWCPERRHMNAAAPLLGHPTIQCWSGAGWGGHDNTLDYLERVAMARDILIVTHRVDGSDRERLSQMACLAQPRGARLVAIDAYDKPCLAWRDAAKAAGFKVFAREAPREGEIPIDYAFNPLWTLPPAPTRPRGIQLIFVGDMGVGRRQAFADAVSMQYPETRVGYTMSFDVWQAALAASQVAVIAHGAGETTYRLWEAAAAGCALLVEQFVTRPAPDDLVEGQTCLFFDGRAGPDDVGGIRAVAQRLLYEAGLSTRLGMAARSAAWTNHTPEACARRLLTEIAK